MSNPMPIVECCKPIKILWGMDMFQIAQRFDKKVEMYWDSMSEEIKGKAYKQSKCPFCGKKLKMRKDL